ncbi:hypothetical protein MRX96_036623 [Rhipicephalus microplus]
MGAQVWTREAVVPRRHQRHRTFTPRERRRTRKANPASLRPHLSASVTQDSKADVSESVPPNHDNAEQRASPREELLSPGNSNTQRRCSRFFCNATDISSSSRGFPQLLRSTKVYPTTKIYAKTQP